MVVGDAEQWLSDGSSHDLFVNICWELSAVVTASCYKLFSVVVVVFFSLNS